MRILTAIIVLLFATSAFAADYSPRPGPLANCACSYASGSVLCQDSRVCQANRGQCIGDCSTCLCHGADGSIICKLCAACRGTNLGPCGLR